MTRINLVPVESLADQHLLAEWREIKMVPASLRRSLRTQSIETVLRKSGAAYTLGKGHVSFFYTRIKFLETRYLQLTNELVRRGVNIEYTGDFSKFVEGLPPQFLAQEWAPTVSEIAINKERILQRILEKSSWYRYFGKVENVSFFKTKLNEEKKHVA